MEHSHEAAHPHPPKPTHPAHAPKPEVEHATKHPVPHAGKDQHEGDHRVRRTAKDERDVDHRLHDLATDQREVDHRVHHVKHPVHQHVLHTEHGLHHPAHTPLDKEHEVEHSIRHSSPPSHHAKAHSAPKRAAAKKSTHAKTKSVAATDKDPHSKRASGKAKKDEHDDKNKKSAKGSKDEQDAKSRKNAKGGKKWTPGRIIGACVVGALFLAGGSFFFYERYTYESTDDAMVQAHTTMLAPKVSGIVTQVLIDEHQRVKAGEVLVRLEQKDYLSELANARANLGSMQVQYANAKRDFSRAASLYHDHAITHQSYDHAYTQYQELDRQVKAAQATLDQAQVNLDYTELRAPTDGFISRKSVEVGMNAVAGTALMGFVQNDERWVIANFKETQLDSVQIGKQVDVKVDAIPGKKFHGIVESISPSSGATFTLFPPDNATGNFTKVVQRVPVKIYLKDLSQSDLDHLQAGLSAVVDVIKHSEVQSLPPHPTAAYMGQMAQSLPDGQNQTVSQAPTQSVMNQAPISNQAPAQNSAAPANRPNSEACPYPASQTK